MQQVHLQAPAGPAKANVDRVGGGLERQQELEDAAAARPALHGHRAAVGLRDRLHDRQTETDPAQVAAAGLIEPGEALEDPLELVGGHAAARVGHHDRHQVALPPGAQLDLVARAGVLDRVLDQRVQGKPKAVGVADDGRRLDGVQPPATAPQGS